MAREPSNQERFEVLLEQVRKELELVAEGYVTLGQKLDRVAEELRGELNSKIDQMAGEFRGGYKQLDQKIDRVAEKVSIGYQELDQKMDRVAERLSKKMDVGFAEVREAVRVVAQQLKDHEHAHT